MFLKQAKDKLMVMIMLMMSICISWMLCSLTCVAVFDARITDNGVDCCCYNECIIEDFAAVVR